MQKYIFHLSYSKWRIIRTPFGRKSTKMTEIWLFQKRMVMWRTQLRGKMHRTSNWSIPGSGTCMHKGCDVVESIYVLFIAKLQMVWLHLYGAANGLAFWAVSEQLRQLNYIEGIHVCLLQKSGKIWSIISKVIEVFSFVIGQCLTANIII